MNEKVLERILIDIEDWQKIVPGVIHPFRAFSLARNFAKSSAQELADFFGISRSYITALENYQKPITTSLYYEYLADRFENINMNSNYKIATTFSVFKKLYKRSLVIENELIFNVIAWLEKTIDLEIKDKLAHLVFEALPTLPYIEVIWEKPLKKQIIEELNKEGVNLPQYWRPGCLPRIILTTSKSLLLAWLLGLITSDELVNHYTNNTYPSVVLMQPKSSTLRRISISGLIAISLFLFDKIIIETNSTIVGEPPIYLSAILKTYEITNIPFHTITWFNIYDLMPLKDLPNIFK